MGILGTCDSGSDEAKFVGGTGTAAKFDSTIATVVRNGKQHVSFSRQKQVLN